jgi:hypothetical protein
LRFGSSIPLLLLPLCSHFIAVFLSLDAAAAASASILLLSK